MSITGTWTIELVTRTETETDLLDLTLRSMSTGGRASVSSFTVPTTALPGLSPGAHPEGEQLYSELVLDAGVLTFEGRVSQGQPSGSFSFAASPQFMEGMQRLGYEGLTAERLFTMAIHDVRLAFVRELTALGYERLPVDQLIEMGLHGVSPDFIRRLQELGYERVPASQLIEMRLHGVSPDFIQELQGAGHTHTRVDQLIAMRMSTV